MNLIREWWSAQVARIIGGDQDEDYSPWADHDDRQIELIRELYQQQGEQS